jgi:hypothetical protein
MIQQQPNIIRYRWSKDYPYKLPKVRYVKSDYDIYKVYKEDVDKPIDFSTFMKIMELCFRAAVSKAFDQKIVKIPYIGDIYLKYVRRRDGKPLMDYRKFKVLHHLTTFPRLKLSTKRKRFRNCAMYSVVASKQIKSFIFKKYVDD